MHHKRFKIRSQNNDVYDQNYGKCCTVGSSKQGSKSTNMHKKNIHPLVVQNLCTFIWEIQIIVMNSIFFSESCKLKIRQKLRVKIFNRFSKGIFIEGKKYCG
jgi:hypothetical protein